MRRALNTTVGLGAAAILTAYVPQFEGMVLRGYKDPIGIVTACAGHTLTAVLGRPYTYQECIELLEKDLAEHAEGADSCVPLKKLSTGRRAAAVSFTYNVGVSKFCNSTFAYKLRLNDPQACAELPKWIYAGGEVLPGLVKRRNVEKAICELPEFS